MKSRVLVISDLHLGGAPASKGQVGFQMCPPAGQQRLADFFDWAAGQARVEGPATLNLVLNGDIVDFLAEPDESGNFSALTTTKSWRAPSWKRCFARRTWCGKRLGAISLRAAKLILLLGNHDVELTLPIRAAKADGQARCGQHRVHLRQRGVDVRPGADRTRQSLRYLERRNSTINCASCARRSRVASQARNCRKFRCSPVAIWPVAIWSCRS